ncbi:Ger(x)C family spore germination protein [Cohnella lupini]|uniref:Spore germination protein KC n=1 Tax=Cohnella lupini TaxID=1294267 RepID=A0A3D9IBM6_9BACL|nr:Ger(x)C family spore germination protein [Cohnella lupini]RED58606.1 spore germination protein KC [Cohnella lupini]
MKPLFRIGLLFTVLIATGCWDRTEINDLAFISGAAFDLNEDGKFLLSLQIAIPSSSQAGPGSGGSNRNEKYFVISAVGKNANEAFEKLQKKSSRRLFTAHRSVIFIGESLAKNGVKDILDVYIHDPRQRLKTYIMVVKGGEGREILQIKYPFEQVPIEAVKEMEGLEGELAVTLRDFFIAASSEGINPVMGVIEAEDLSEGLRGNKNKIFSLAGLAVFKELKLVGFLDENETAGFIWLTDRLKQGRLSAELPEGAGTVGMVLNDTKRRITSQISGDRIKIELRLEGQGNISENNSRLDISLPNNLGIARVALEKSVENQVRDTLFKVQAKYKVDSVGFGREIYRNKPKQWKTLKNEWDHTFPDVEVSIEVKLTLGTGMAGAPMQWKEEEIEE